MKKTSIRYLTLATIVDHVRNDISCGNAGADACLGGRFSIEQIARAKAWLTKKRLLRRDGKPSTKGCRLVDVAREIPF